MATTTAPAIARKSPLLWRRKPLLPDDIKPRFVRETVLIPNKEGLVVDGTHRLQVLKGKSARSLLPELIPLLDGMRSLQQMERSLPGVAPEHVRAAISVLRTAGLIEHNPDIPSTQVNIETLAFLRRTIAFTGSNRSGHEAYEKLHASQVFVFSSGAPDHQDCLVPLLRKTGVDKLMLLSRSSLHEWPLAGAPASDTFFVSMVVGEEDPEWHKKLDCWCAERGISWLRAVLDTRHQTAELGPLFLHDENPCYECFTKMHSRPFRSQGAEHRRGELERADLMLWSGMVATEIVYLLTDIAPPLSARECVRYEINNWSSQRLRAARLPGCPHCRPAASVSESPDGVQRIETAVVFEDLIGIQSTAYASARNESESNHLALSLTQQVKRLANCSQYSLPRDVQKLDYGALDMLYPGLTESGTKATHVSELGAILQFTAGIRQSRTPTSQVKRWGATGGNLGSVEAFVAARNVEGLPPGLYFYDPRAHALSAFQFRGRGIEIDTFIGRVLRENASDLPDALILLTGAYHRVSRKYGPFGYRLVNLDAGVALAQAHIVARSLGLHSRTLTWWPDDLLAAQLNLENHMELATAVLELSGVRRSSRQLRAEIAGPATKRESRVRRVREFDALSISEVTAMLIDESRMREAESDHPPAHPVVASASARAALQWTELPPPMQGGRLVSEVLSRRTSVRRYTPEMLSLCQLNTMLRCAYSGDAEDWLKLHKGEIPLKFVVLASRVEGLLTGVYEYDPSGERLGWIAEMPDSESMAELFVQREFVAAPLLIWIFGDLAAACARHGAFGHRQLLLRAGAAAHRLWLAALGMGLAGCLVGGMVPGAARRKFAFDGYRDATLLAFATGYGAQSMK
ncbi:MAG TPA: SagB family peptide dehydrogenase [Candidatus Acidoferrales bacterium]|nr:SagB family peptide dehydrogenase [Candidatus Acidoferrales bacterium]